MKKFKIKLIVFLLLIINNTSYSQTSLNDLNLFFKYYPQEIAFGYNTGYHVFFGDSDAYILNRFNKTVEVPRSQSMFSIYKKNNEIHWNHSNAVIYPYNVKYIGTYSLIIKGDIAYLKCKFKEVTNSKYPAEPNLTLSINLKNNTGIATESSAPSYPIHSYGNFKKISEKNEISKLDVYWNPEDKITIENIEIAALDLPNAMPKYEISDVIEKIGHGWRLPTMDELKLIYLNKNLISGLKQNNIYWSSSYQENKDPYVLHFQSGKFFALSTTNYFYVRLVRNIEAKGSDNVSLQSYTEKKVGYEDIVKQKALDLILMQKKEEEALIKRYEAESLQKRTNDLNFAKRIIENSITIGKILIANNDFAEPMNWDDAKKACESLGNGWRLPNKDELRILYRNKDKIGGFVGSATYAYWSSTEFGSNGNEAWFMYFNKYPLRFGDPKTKKNFVRAVKNL
jgi:hypothetical protein